MSSKNLETRKRILEAAARLLEEHRGDGVRMSDVARKAGVSRQAVYLHFGSRAELMIATARYGDDVRGLQGRLVEYRAAASGVERLDAYIEFWGNYVPEILGIARALRALSNTDEAARAAWDDRMGVVHEACRDIIGRLSDDGKLAEGWSVDEAADLLWATLSVGNWESLATERGWTVEQYVRGIKDLCRHAFVESE